MVMRSVDRAMIRIPAQPGSALDPGLIAVRSWAPTITLTDDQPKQARMLSIATYGNKLVSYVRARECTSVSKGKKGRL